MLHFDILFSLTLMFGIFIIMFMSTLNSLFIEVDDVPGHIWILIDHFLNNFSFAIVKIIKFFLYVVGYLIWKVWWQMWVV